MKNEYIIINKSVLEKRIEELFTEAKELLEEDGLEWQDEFLNYKDFSPNFEEHSDNSKYFYIIMGKIESLQDFLSQSTPLIPEIEKAFDEGQNRMQHEIIEKLGLKYQTEQVSQSTILNMEVHSEDYISNLKLDI